MLQQLKAGVEQIGERTISAIEDVGNISMLLAQTLIWAVRPPYRFKIFLLVNIIKLYQKARCCWCGFGTNIVAFATYKHH